jgi:hypothetical protein
LHNLKSVVQRFAPSLVIEEIVKEAQSSLAAIEMDVLALANSKLQAATRVKEAGVQLSREKAQEWN